MTRLGPGARRLAAGGLTAAAIALALWWLLRSNHQVGADLGRIGWGAAAAAGAVLVASLVATWAGWMALLGGLGVRLPARRGARVFFVGQLGKYVPGGIWSVVSQVDLAAREGAPGRVVGAAQAVLLIVSLTTALLLSLLVVPALASSGSAAYLAVFALLLPLGALTHPRVLRAVVGRALRLIRRPPPAEWPDARTMRAVFLLTLASNVAVGVQAWLLARPFGGGAGLFPLAVGGYVLAVAVGFLVVPLPSGAGLREAIFAVVLGHRVPIGAAAAVALASRGLAVAADLAAAAVAAGVARMER